MAEVTVSVDDEGAARGAGTAGEQQDFGAASMPPVPGEQLPPLRLTPPPSSAPPYGGTQRRAAPVTRPVTPGEWVHDEDDYWDTQSLIAVSGRRAIPRPKPRPLEPPQRFRPVRRWQSMAALVAVSVVILVACVGTLQATRFANNLLHPRQPVPTLTRPTASPSVAPSPTAKPRKK